LFIRYHVIDSALCGPLSKDVQLANSGGTNMRPQSVKLDQF